MPSVLTGTQVWLAPTTVCGKLTHMHNAFEHADTRGMHSGLQLPGILQLPKLQRRIGLPPREVALPRGGPCLKPEPYLLALRLVAPQAGRLGNISLSLCPAVAPCARQRSLVSKAYQYGIRSIS